MRCRGPADLAVVVVFVRVVAGAEVDLQLAGLPQPRPVVRARKGAVQQVDAVEVRGVGDTGDFRGHGLIFGFDHQTLVGVVGTRGRLFGQFLHADELFVDDLQRAVSGLDHRDGVVGVADALTHGGNICPHQFANGEACGVVGRSAHAQTRGKAAGGRCQATVALVQVTRGVQRHHVVIDDQRHVVNLLRVVWSSLSNVGANVFFAKKGKVLAKL
ncbi:hypothetical protein DSECCO2_655050 [anaerobic digester metagenome]